MRIEADEVLEAMDWLHDYYKSDQGLGRPNGLSISGKPDFEGIAAWILDVFANSRAAGLTIEQCKQNIEGSIQQIDEWRNRHPNTPGARRTPYTPSIPIGRDEFLQALHRLDVFYKSWNGLQRKDGLSIDGRPDFRAIAAWIFGSYLNDRTIGLSGEDAWDRLVLTIKSTVEWRQKDRAAVDVNGIEGKHLVGYQGWFSTPNDGQNNGWDHWFGGNPAHPNFDLWPDTREFFDSELAPTELTLKNGQPAKLYSCHNERTMRRHFDWMADVGIDGASLGRFYAGTRDKNTRRRLDHVLTNMSGAAEHTGRVFFVWYDTTDSSHETFDADVRDDWAHLHDGMRITAHPRYLRHRGKPLVGLWGAGADGRPGTPDEWIRALTFLKTYRDGATVLLGGVRDWQTNAQWARVFAVADIVSPWAINAFGDEAGADDYRKSTIEPDLAFARSRGQDYLPTIFPGFSWRNLQGGKAPQNSTARRNGAFYWRQAFNAVDAGATTLFTAMFDEVDEGTAILKVAETERDVPADGEFIAMDFEGQSLPSDWYLRLAGAARRMLRGEIGRTRSIPIRP